LLGFLRLNARWLATGMLLTFASAPGQTWFIALFAGELRAAYGLTVGGWGLIYTAATLAAAVLLLARGGLADTVRLSRLGPGVALLFAAAALAVAAGGPVWTLLAGVFLLRFCGQGMFSHIAMTAMGRWFVATRGRAVAIAGLGYAAAESLLPVPLVLLIAAVGWQGAWAAAAAVLALVVAPLLLWLMASDRVPAGGISGQSSTGLGDRHWSRRDVLGHWLFPAILPVMLTTPFLGTVIFFHQVHIAETKGWALATMAQGYPLFAATTVAATLVAGTAADRFGPGGLMPLLSLPLAVALVVLSLAGSAAGWLVALVLYGLTQGIANGLWGVFLPWVYGTRHLGAVRALASAIMVVSTAVGPALSGMLIDAGLAFTAQAMVFAAWCLILGPWALAVRRRLDRERTAAAVT